MTIKIREVVNNTNDTLYYDNKKSGRQFTILAKDPQSAEPASEVPAKDLANGSTADPVPEPNSSGTVDKYLEIKIGSKGVIEKYYCNENKLALDLPGDHPGDEYTKVVGSVVDDKEYILVFDRNPGVTERVNLTLKLANVPDSGIPTSFTNSVLMTFAYLSTLRLPSEKRLRRTRERKE